MTVEAPAPALLSAAAVSARYPSAARPALAAVSLAVNPGEIAVLLGPNGAGKSTFLRLAAGLLPASSGAVMLNGRDVRTLDRRTVSRLAALVPQHELPAAGFTVRAVVAMGRTPHQTGWMQERAEDTAAIELALTRCDLGAVASRTVDTLSGGEQRRVAVARALAARPRLLLLDEPAAFLDVRHRIEQCDLLADVAAKDRVACVVSMHDLDAAARIATTVLLLREGRVVAQGPVPEVMTPDRLRATFDADVEVGLHAASGRRYFVPLSVANAAIRGE